MKKGFTLIELLAVIIVLGIIALIATPIVLDVIEDVRSEANYQTAQGLISAANNYYAESLLDDSKKYNVENKNDIYDLVTVNGEKPSQGKLYVNDEGRVAISVFIEDKCYVKGFDDSLQELDGNDENCDLGYISSDKNKPSVAFEILGDKTGEWYTDGVYVKINASDLESGLLNYKWCAGINCEPSNVETENEKSVFLNDTETQVCVIAYDKALNASDKTCTDLLKIDSTKPVCSFGELTYIGINSIGTLDLTCTSSLSTLQDKELLASDFELSNSNISIDSIAKEEVENGYKYTIKLLGTTEGKTNITLKENVFINEAGNTSASVSKEVTVNALSLASTSGSTLTKGYKLRSNINGSNYGTLSCSSENTNIASCQVLNNQLVITPNATSGNATITLTSTNGLSAEYEVSVSDKAEYADSILNGADPELDEGMIPVNIASDGSLTKADLRLEWYNYTDKEWANIVLVSEDVRETYKNMNTGETIDTSKVLAYYVWVPRYRYQIFNDVNNILTGQDYESNTVQLINVVFENKNTSKSTGTSKGSYLTHPAFTFGSDELNGLWVGKFETTGTASNPTILPNKSSLRSQKVSAQFKTSLLFANNALNSDGSITHATNTTYGINNSDSHMMKNSEWGAVAYLTGSKYGQGTTEVRINNSSSYITGCAATTAATTKTYAEYLQQTDGSEGWYAGCENAYNTEIGVLASTTGNITGIYDMSGGAWEYMMAVMEDAAGSGVPLSGRNNLYNSGFTGNLGCPSCEATSGNDSSITSITGITYPNSKYYDLYTYGTSAVDVAAYSRGQLGDSTYELGSFSSNVSDGDGATRYHSTWNKDYAHFVNHGYPWFMRGGYWSHGSGTGVFAFNNYYGHANSAFSFRAVLSK